MKNLLTFLLSLGFFSQGFLSLKAPHWPTESAYEEHCEELRRNASLENNIINKTKIYPFSKKNVHNGALKNWSQLNFLVDHLLHKSKVQTKEILIITDLDGTMTTNRNPQDEKFQDSLTFQPHSQEIIRHFLGQDIALAVSSAWSNFHDTLLRIYKGGLEDVLLSHYFVEGKGKISGRKENFHYRGCGHVFSFGDEKDFYGFYRHKFFSGFSLTQTQRETIKIIIFLDDSDLNINIFQEDLLTSNIYPLLEKVFIYHFFDEEINKKKEENLLIDYFPLYKNPLDIQGQQDELSYFSIEGKEKTTNNLKKGMMKLFEENEIKSTDMRDQDNTSLLSLEEQNKFLQEKIKGLEKNIELMEETIDILLSLNPQFKKKFIHRIKKDNFYETLNTKSISCFDEEKEPINQQEAS